MKMKYFYTACIFLALLFVGCGDKKYTDASQLEGNCQIGGEDAPHWICGGVDIKDTFTDVGIAKATTLGSGEQRRMALTDAKSNLSQQLSSYTKDKITKNVSIKDKVSQKQYAHVSNQVASMALKNVKQLQMWTNPKDGTLYVIIGVNKKNIDDRIDMEINKIYSKNPSGTNKKATSK